MKKQLVFGFIIAGVCLYFAFKGIAVGGLITTLRMAKIRWIVVAIAIYTVGYLLRTLRWSILLEPVKPILASALFAPMAIGYFANNVLPFRMGELVRAHITGIKFKISRTASLGTILLERLCDTLSFLTTFCFVALFFPFPAMAERGAAALATACFLVIATLVFIIRHRIQFNRIVEKFISSAVWKQKLFNVVDKFSEGIGSMKRAKPISQALCLSLLIWIIEGTFLYLMARAFDVPLGYPQSFFLLFFMGLSVTLPQAPGYIGTVELFGVTALSLLSIPKERALPLILAIHGTQFAFIFVLGVVSLWKEGISLKSLTTMEKY